MISIPNYKKNKKNIKKKDFAPPLSYLRIAILEPQLRKLIVYTTMALKKCDFDHWV